MTTPPRPQRQRRGGFTLMELLMAMVLGVLILGVSSNFAIATLRASRATDRRDGMNRSSRYIGMAIQRDLQEAGLSFSSTATSGALATRGDTVVAISVPFLPNEAEIYTMSPPVPWPTLGVNTGTCGTRCIDVVDPNLMPFQLAAGQPALLQVQSNRRLIVITSVGSGALAGTKRITWASGDSLFVWPVGLRSLTLPSSGVSIQRLNVTQWFRRASDSTLIRSAGFSAAGVPAQTVVSRGVLSFEARLRFTNGAEAQAANGFDADTTNDYNDIMSVVARARLRVDGVDNSVNGGGMLFRDYEWQAVPRNMVFERNRP